MPDFTKRLAERARPATRALRLAVREPGEGLTAVRMAAWVAALSVLVKFVPLPRALALVAPAGLGPLTGRPAETQARLARILDSVLAADFWFLTPTCWKRAPVLHRFLAKNGIETRIVFGVRREQEEPLSGHAWLEAGGEPLLETTPPDYIVTFSFPE